jgi:hypothetical protein
MFAASLAAATASVAAFGLESWHAFFAWMPVTSNAVFTEGRAGLMKLQSLLGLVRWLGGGMTAAWAAQGVLIAAAAILSARLWRQRVRYEIKAAALAVAAMLATPYLYIYDFPVLAIPLAFLMRWGCGTASCRMSCRGSRWPAASSWRSRSSRSRLDSSLQRWSRRWSLGGPSTQAAPHRARPCWIAPNIADIDPKLQYRPIAHNNA